MLTRVVGAALGAVLVMGACSSDTKAPVAPDEDTPNGLWEGLVAAEFVSDSLVLTNQTERTVGYVVMERDMAMLAIFPPCVSNCQMLEPGAAVTLTVDEIAGVTAESREVRVHWWSYDRHGAPVGGMSSSTIRLPGR